jgi:hypothetical protein
MKQMVHVHLGAGVLAEAGTVPDGEDVRGSLILATSACVPG